MIDLLQPYFPYFPYILGGLIALSILLLFLALFNLRRQRTAEVWRSRHNAGKWGERLLLISISMLIAAIFISVVSVAAIYALGYENDFFPPRNPYGVSGVAVSSLQTPAVTHTNSVTPIPVVIQTMTPTVTATVSILPSQVIVTRTQTPTRRPTVTVIPTALTASLRVIAVDDQLTENQTPMNPRKIFDSNTPRLYFFISYNGMIEDVNWSQILYRDGEPIHSDTSSWNFGVAGANYFSLAEDMDYLPGKYEMHLFIDDTEVDTFTFEVVDF